MSTPKARRPTPTGAGGDGFGNLWSGVYGGIDGVRWDNSETEEDKAVQSRIRNAVNKPAHKKPNMRDYILCLQRREARPHFRDKWVLLRSTSQRGYS